MTGQPRKRLEGASLPGSPVSFYGLGRIEPVSLRELLGYGRHLVVGLPDASASIFDGHEIPELLMRADLLKRAGVQSINCVVSSRPQAVQTWRRSVDPDEQLRFFSDAGLDFSRALDLVYEVPSEASELRSRRYLLMVEDGVIERARVEEAVRDFDFGDTDLVMLAV